MKEYVCAGTATAGGAHLGVRADARGGLLEAGQRMDQELKEPGRGKQCSVRYSTHSIILRIKSIF